MWPKRTSNERFNLQHRSYNTPIYVYQKNVTKDDKGLEHEEWQLKFKLFADVKQQHGRDYDIARQISNKKTWIIVTRYTPDIDESMEIVIGTKRYSIDNIDNIRLENFELEIRAIEIPHPKEKGHV